MRYLSTRGSGASVSLSQAIVAGLANEGGLFVPERFPRVAAGAIASSPLSRTALHVLEPYFEGDSLAAELEAIADSAFDFPAPVTRVAGTRIDVLELFHGPTGAFKDFGARFLAACMTRIERGAERPLTILVATSGDTGGAVAAAFHRQPGIQVVILFPKGRVSPRQEHQLTCWDTNVSALAVRGTFDDCQKLVKTAFQDSSLRGICRLTSANSINIGRLLPQTVYYSAASLQVWERTGKPASFIVPSGNLGNATACLWAREMGMPIEHVVLAHNANRTVPDFLDSGSWRPRASVATLASAMDVGDPSNMERVRARYPDVDSLRDGVSADWVNDAEISQRIAADFRAYGRTWCPHTATAAEVFARLPVTRRREASWVLVATAHPAKFAEIVEPLTGREVPLPPALAELLRRPRSHVEIEPAFQALSEYLQEKCSSH
jgi:threonine synthase